MSDGLSPARSEEGACSPSAVGARLSRVDGVQWGAEGVFLLVFSSVMAVAFPIVMRFKLASPQLLREQVMLSTSRGVVIWTVLVALGAGLFGLTSVFVALEFPVGWGIAAMAISVLVCTLWYAILYRRTIREMERELMSRDAAHPDPD